MDISSLLSTSVPSYFVIGPLLIIVITLVVLSAVKASPTTPPVAVAPVVPPVDVVPATAPATPVATVAPLPGQPVDLSAHISNQPQPLTPLAEVEPAPAPIPEVLQPLTASPMPTPFSVSTPTPAVTPEPVPEPASLPVVEQMPTPVVDAAVTTPSPIEPMVATPAPEEMSAPAPQVAEVPVTDSKEPVMEFIPTTPEEHAQETAVVSDLQVTDPQADQVAVETVADTQSQSQIAQETIAAAPEVVITQTPSAEIAPKPSVQTGVIPPISSWKPIEPAASPVEAQPVPQV